MKTSYQIELKTITPIHIGCGNDILKTEYIRNENEISVVDSLKLFSFIQKNNKGEEYYNFMNLASEQNNNNDSNLLVFLNNNCPNYKENIEAFLKYRIHISKYEKLYNLSTFIRDKKTNKAYIPGSSIKGAIANALCYYLASINKEDIEIEEKIKNASKDLKSIMSKISISDSSLIENKDMFVSKVTYYNYENGEEKNLNQLYEFINGNVSINFIITLDEVFIPIINKKIGINDLLTLINKYFELYKTKYLIDFSKKNGNIVDIKLQEGMSILSLGSKTGLQNKTVYYQLLEQSEAAEKHKDIILKKFRKNNICDGISPINLKCIKSNDKYFPCGICQIKVLKEI